MIRAMILAVVAGCGLLMTAAPAEAGRVRGPGDDVAVVSAYGSVTYHENFRGGERASLLVIGDGSTRLRVAVYDEDGHYITSETGYTCLLNWNPIWTGPFTIRVTNLGPDANLFAMQSN